MAQNVRTRLVVAMFALAVLIAPQAFAQQAPVYQGGVSTTGGTGQVLQGRVTQNDASCAGGGLRRPWIQDPSPFCIWDLAGSIAQQENNGAVDCRYREDLADFDSLQSRPGAQAVKPCVDLVRQKFSIDSEIINLQARGQNSQASGLVAQRNKLQGAIQQCLQRTSTRPTAFDVLYCGENVPGPGSGVPGYIPGIGAGGNTPGGGVPGPIPGGVAGGNTPGGAPGYIPGGATNDPTSQPRFPGPIDPATGRPLPPRPGPILSSRVTTDPCAQCQSEYDAAINSCRNNVTPYTGPAQQQRQTQQYNQCVGDANQTHYQCIQACRSAPNLAKATAKQEQRCPQCEPPYQAAVRACDAQYAQSQEQPLRRITQRTQCLGNAEIARDNCRRTCLGQTGTDLTPDPCPT